MGSHSTAQRKRHDSQPGSGAGTAKAGASGCEPGPAAAQLRIGDALNTSRPVAQLQTVSALLNGGKPAERPLAERVAQRLERVSAAAAGDGSAAAVRQLAHQGTRGAAGPLPYLPVIQRAFGVDLSHVAAHTDRQAGAAASAMGAKAFATGNHVAFAETPDLHTAAHEATHVIQQRAGVQLKDGVGDACDAYERQADEVADLVVQGKSAAGLLETAGSDGGDGMAGMSGGQAVQLKGPVTLISLMDRYLNWVRGKNGNALEGGTDINLSGLFARITEYDGEGEGRPDTQAQTLTAMLVEIAAWKQSHLAQMTEDDFTCLGEIEHIVFNERKLVQKQADRLETYTADDKGPYRQMTDEGLMWTRKEFEHNTTKEQVAGRSYFDRLSDLNMNSMDEEIADRRHDESEWFGPLIQRIEDLLKAAVLNHYTTAARVPNLLQGGLKSKMMLKKTVANFKDNSEDYDEAGLANTGFVFFYIDPPNSEFRPSRFGQADGPEVPPARVSVPIQESGLLERGWLMLSDFAQRENPDIATNEENSDHRAWLHNREKGYLEKPENAGFTKKVRHFDYRTDPLTEGQIDEISAEKNKVRKNALLLTLPQLNGDSKSKQVYHGQDGEDEVSDRLAQNILSGPQIIPGLAKRSAIEVARIEKRNPAFAKHVLTLGDQKLLQFVLKDLFRPQAMIPNRIDVAENMVEYPH